MIQLERQGGTYMVPVRINDAITLNFVLDSGAADVAIPVDVFLTLTRTGTVKKSDFIGKGTYVLADGSEQPSERFLLHELRIGDHVIRNVVANVAPSKAIPYWAKVSFPNCPPGRLTTRGTLSSSTISPGRLENSRQRRLGSPPSGRSK
jgi:hypothetical protein